MLILYGRLLTFCEATISNAREIIDYFGFTEHISKLDEADMLYMIVKRFGEIDLHPNKVSNLEMGYIFEELIRRFSELSNEMAGEHFTPREVIRLMVNLLFVNDKEILTKEGIVRTLYDPTSGTGGMLSISLIFVIPGREKRKLEQHKSLSTGKIIRPGTRMTRIGRIYTDNEIRVLSFIMQTKKSDTSGIFLQ